MNCAICQISPSSEDTPKNFVLCVLNCSHNYCLECIITHSTQFGQTHNGKAHAVVNSNNIMQKNNHRHHTYAIISNYG